MAQVIVEKNMVFHKFLEDAIQMTDDESFTEIGPPPLPPPPPSTHVPPTTGDLLLRHETLAHHHDDLMQRSVTFSALADEARARLQEVSLLQRETKLKGGVGWGGVGWGGVGWGGVAVHSTAHVAVDGTLLPLSVPRSRSK
jgi:hypothetical protein